MAKLPCVEPDKKSLIRVAVGLALAAKRTDCRSSALAMLATIGSVEDRIFIAWTMVWMSASRVGS